MTSLVVEKYCAKVPTIFSSGMYSQAQDAMMFFEEVNAVTAYLEEQRLAALKSAQTGKLHQAAQVLQDVVNCCEHMQRANSAMRAQALQDLASVLSSVQKTALKVGTFFLETLVAWLV